MDVVYNSYDYPVVHNFYGRVVSWTILFLVRKISF